MEYDRISRYQPPFQNFNQMMHLVPAHKDRIEFNNHSHSQHLDLHILDCRRVPSPCPSPDEYLTSTPQMFSPASASTASSHDLQQPPGVVYKEVGGVGSLLHHRQISSTSPCPSTSSYSPTPRERSLSSNIELGGPFNLHHSHDIKTEDQDMEVSSNTTFNHSTQMTDLLEAHISNIKLEPMDQGGGGGGARPSLHSNTSRTTLSRQDIGSAVFISQENVILKQQLQDTSFQSKYNLRPFTIGEMHGFVFHEPLEQAKRGPFGGGSCTAMQTDDLHPKLEARRSAVEVARQLAKEGLLMKDEDLKDVKPVLDQMQLHIKGYIEKTCAILHLSKDPRNWSPANVKSWLFWTLQKVPTPQASINMENWHIDGEQMCSFNEEDFLTRLPQAGSTVFAHFNLWRSSYDDCYQNPPGVHLVNQMLQCGGQMMILQPPEQMEQPTDLSASSGMTADLPPPPYSFSANTADKHSFAASAAAVDKRPPSSPFGGSVTSSGGATFAVDSAYCSPPPPAPPAYLEPRHHLADTSREEEEDSEEEVDIKASPSSGRTTTNIHLWQFVKELLNQADQYGNYIQWVDRSQGVFKIIDSVKVATLWGKRKNRPAMNYDKLSRSLRQYYKKGIMKKTERSQRLVYQFCHPYHL